MENKELLQIMEKCGHFLYHRRGGGKGQLRILKLIDEKGTVTQSELLQSLTIKSGSVSEAVGKLEQRGFITKERAKEDKRKINICLTCEGKAYLEKQLSVNSEQERVLFDALTLHEQQQLNELLNKLFNDWQNKFDNTLFNHRKGD